jgi:hypothetical protein
MTYRLINCIPAENGKSASLVLGNEYGESFVVFAYEMRRGGWVASMPLSDDTDTEGARRRVARRQVAERAPHFPALVQKVCLRDWALDQ